MIYYIYSIACRPWEAEVWIGKWSADPDFEVTASPSESDDEGTWSCIVTVTTSHRDKALRHKLCGVPFIEVSP